MNIKQKGGADYSGDTESSRANRNIGKGRKGKKKQKGRVVSVSEGQKEDFTKKQKRATKRIIRKSNRMYRAEERQAKREKRTGSKEGTGLIGKVRKKFIDANKKRRSKGIDKNMDKLTFNQAFNTGRRYTPGKTFNYKGKEYKEKLRKKKTDQSTDRYPGPPPLPRQDGGALDAAGMLPGTGIKPDSKSIDYNTALSALGLIPAVGKAGKALIKAAKIAKAAKKAAPKKKGKKVRKPLNYKKQTGGSFNTGQGSFIEPGTEQI